MSIQIKRIKVEVGAIPKKKNKDIIYFSSFEEMNKVLTSSRVEILNAIKEHNPESIYELAKILEKDQSNITKDVNLLEKYGFLEIEKKKKGERITSKPNFEGDSIEMVIKMGAGMFGMAKGALENISKEFKEDKLNKNKEYTRKQLRKALKPFKEVAQKIVDELDK